MEAIDNLVQAVLSANVRDQRIVRENFQRVSKEIQPLLRT
jgi:hypothetical protein